MSFISDSPIPKSAMDWYIKLYCKRRGVNSKSNKIFVEATKSWLTLNKSERLDFINKYTECKSQFQNKLAMQLKNVEPYMKKKKTVESINESCQEVKHLENVDASKLNITDQPNFQRSSEDKNVINCEEYSTSSGKNVFNDSVIIEEGKPQAIQKEIIMSEPTPPASLNGKELFEMVRKNEDKDLTWTELLPHQKRQFQQAVLKIKRNYIKQYQAYLESLSSFKLLEHYRNVKTDID